MISSPIFFIGMVLLGAVFCVKPLGRHGTGKRLFIAIIIAFVIFFLNDVIAALGQGSQAPELLAKRQRAFVPILLSTSLLLYLEMDKFKLVLKYIFIKFILIIISQIFIIFQELQIR